MIKPIVPAAEVAGKPKKLLEQMRDVLRRKHYSLRTERTYCDWVKRYLRFHAGRAVRPRDLDPDQPPLKKPAGRPIGSRSVLYLNRPVEPDQESDQGNLGRFPQSTCHRGGVNF